MFDPTESRGESAAWERRLEAMAAELEAEAQAVDDAWTAKCEAMASDLSETPAPPYASPN